MIKELVPPPASRAVNAFLARWRSPPHALLLLAGLTIVSVIVVLESLRWTSTIHPDWLIASTASRDLLGPHYLAVYADHPSAQMGPLAIAVAALPRTAYVAGVAALVLPYLWVLSSLPRYGMDRSVPSRLLRSGLAVLYALALVVPWSQLAWKGHADDALVLLGAAVVVAGRRRGTRLLGLGIAIAGKPTGLVLLPLVLGSFPEALGTILVLVAVWAPFVVAHPTAMLDAGKGVMRVVPGSLPTYVGVAPKAAPPVWVRLAQLLGGLSRVACGRLRRNPLAGLTLAFTLRAILDPNPAPAYSISVVALAWGLDLGYRYPLALVPAAASFWLSQGVLEGGTGVWRLACLSFATAVCIGRLVLGPSSAIPTQRATKAPSATTAASTA